GAGRHGVHAGERGFFLDQAGVPPGVWVAAKGRSGVFRLGGLSLVPLVAGKPDAGADPIVRGESKGAGVLARRGVRAGWHGRAGLAAFVAAERAAVVAGVRGALVSVPRIHGAPVYRVRSLRLFV